MIESVTDEVLTGQIWPEPEAETKRDLLCEAADEMKARDITTLDVRGLTSLADYFVVCGGTSTTHIQSVAQGVRDKARERAGLRTKPEGNAASRWIVLDYGDVIMHIFDEETREFYDLERLWADAKLATYAPQETPLVNEEDRFSQSTPEPRA